MNDDINERVDRLRERWLALREAEYDERKFNPNEPRIPKGQKGGGKWFTLEVIKGAAGWAKPSKELASEPGSIKPSASVVKLSKAGGVLEKVAREITAVEARGNSRPVSREEFQKIAGRGKEMLDKMHDNRSPITRLDRRWDKVKRDTYGEVQKSWGGATVDAHTGIPLLSDADRYALSIKPEHLNSVSVSEHASEVEFSQAMDQAKEQFREILENEGSHLGIFHDDENHRIDIDPVVVVDSLDEVEAIGAYTHAIGGAYHFKSGDGFWPPHVVEQGQDLPFHAYAMTPGLDELVHAGRSRDIKLGDKVTWKGPGQWRSYADKVQRPKGK